GGGQCVDGVERHAVCPAALERRRRHLGGRPPASVEAGEVVGDGAVEGFGSGAAAQPGGGAAGECGHGGQGGEPGNGLAAGKGHGSRGVGEQVRSDRAIYCRPRPPAPGPATFQSLNFTPLPHPECIMNKPTRRTLLAVGAVFGTVVVLLIALPLLFGGRIADRVKVEVNRKVEARIDWQTASLGLFRNFPNLTLRLGELTAVGTGRFEGDTLAAVQHL